MQSLPSWVLGGVGQGKTQVLTIQPVFLVTKMLPSDIKICPAVFSSCSFNYCIFFSKDLELVKVQYPRRPVEYFSQPISRSQCQCREQAAYLLPKSISMSVCNVLGRRLWHGVNNNAADNVAGRRATPRLISCDELLTPLALLTPFIRGSEWWNSGCHQSFVSGLELWFSIKEKCIWLIHAKVKAHLSLS